MACFTTSVGQRYSCATQDERPFVSCRKVMMDMGAPYDKTELVSFHTISKVRLSRLLQYTIFHPELISLATCPDDTAAP